MSLAEMERLRKLLIKHEGLVLKPYHCTAGHLTIGVGRNLDSCGISEAEALMLLHADIERVHQEAVSTLPWFKSISVTRQDVVLSMIFNLGMTRFLEFKKMIKAITDGDFEKAANEMLVSKWAGQVGIRASDLALMMKTDRYYIAQ